MKASKSTKRRTVRCALRISVASLALFVFISAVHADVNVSAADLGKEVPTSSLPSQNPPTAYILIDNDTGNVLASNNDRTPLPPASITKLLTALVVVARLPEGTKIPIGADAEHMPAMKADLKEGESWPRDTLLRALLMISANDAAVALADAVSPNLSEFSQVRANAARDLGLADNPVFNDPAGLDDAEFSNAGGDRVSARDMVIIARAALKDDTIRTIVATQRWDFTAPNGSSHYFINHNKLLKTYPGAIGMKTGYTKLASHTLVAAAQRDGRTMVVVLMGAENPMGWAAKYMDQGFAIPVNKESSQDRIKVTAVRVQHVVGETKPASQRITSQRVWLETTSAWRAIVVLVVLAAAMLFAARKVGRPKIHVRYDNPHDMSQAPNDRKGKMNFNRRSRT